MRLSIVCPLRKKACAGDNRLFKFRRTQCELNLVCRYRAAAMGLTPARDICGFSRKVAYLLILSSFLALCSVTIQPVSSQAFYTSTTTKTNIATYFTVSVATANLSVTFLTVQYTTATSVFTVQNVQFTTLTSFLTRVRVDAPTGEFVLAYHTSHGRESKFQHPGPFRALSIGGESPAGYIDSGIVLQSIEFTAVILTSALLILQKKLP
jgi:hypothetical protein